MAAILIVEDDKMTNDVICDYLCDAGHMVYQAFDGTEALKRMEEEEVENIRVSEAEAAKIDFLRAASHELKTPVTALCGMLDNMIMGIGRYRDWETYLLVCKDMAGRFGVMIQEILDASRLNFTFEIETMEEKHE